MAYVWGALEASGATKYGAGIRQHRTSATQLTSVLSESLPLDGNYVTYCILNCCD